MNFNRLLLGVTSGVLLGAIAVTAFTLSRKKPFHVRLRKKRPPRYQLQNVGLFGSSIRGDLTTGRRIFTLHLTFFSSEIVHFRVTDPTHERFIVKDVIILEPKKTNIRIHQLNNELQVDYKNLSVTINCNDFLIQVSRNNEPFVFVNSQRSFVIEEQEPHVGISADFLFPKATKAYGLPQHAERLSLCDNKAYRLFNTDRFAYSTSSPQESLYGAVPLIYAHSADQTTGLLWLNASETYIDLKNDFGLTSTFFSESGTADFYILSGPSLQDCVRQNSELTGVAPLPPLFALGYHQCRYSYMTQEEVIEVSNKFDEHQLPLDSVWLDIDYTDEMKYFTWNPTTFPDPQLLLDFLENKKRNAVVIIDPHFKVDDDYFVYKECKENGYFINNSNGTPFTAKCWPGTSSWIDFLNPEARQYYACLHPPFAKSSNLHIWNDMNEPALFETHENAMSKTALHGPWKHRDVHNLYGFYQTMATYEGLLQRPNLRPFILTRAHFIGSQRFAAIWTGDNTASWDHLKISVPMCLTASLTGFSFCGADIGGFVKHPDEELLVRWYQLGAWLPFFRGHSNRNVPRREPYLFSDVVLRRIRICLQQRYMYLLHWYTLFWRHWVTLEPVIRPLVYQYPQDENVADLDGCFLVGSDILVCPVMEQVEHLNVYLPGDNERWFHGSSVYGGGNITIAVDMDAIPVFYRGGCIIPTVEQSVSSSALLKDCSITLLVFCDIRGAATGSLYSDDHRSFLYQEKQYHYVQLDFKGSTISNKQIHCGYNHPVFVDAIKVYGYKKSMTKAKVHVGDTSKTLLVLNNPHVVEIKNLNLNLQQNFIITLSQ